MLRRSYAFGFEVARLKRDRMGGSRIHLRDSDARELASVLVTIGAIIGSGDLRGDRTHRRSGGERFRWRWWWRGPWH